MNENKKYKQNQLIIDGGLAYQLIKWHIYMRSFVKCVWVIHPHFTKLYVATIMFSSEAAMQSDKKIT